MRALLSAALAATALLAAACGAPPQTVRSNEVFGTRVSVVVNAPPATAGAAIGEVFAHFDSMHQRFHAWREGELAGVNRAIAGGNLPMTVSAQMAEMLALAADCARRSGGRFNPAAGKLFALWGFHADVSPQRPPPPHLIAAYLAAPPQPRDIRLRGRVLQSAPATAQLDFGGVAKGVALDDARDIFHRHKIRSALINIGGNILALGQNNGRPWRVRLSPVGGVVELADGEAVATSGGSARFFIYRGRRYHHIIDPRSGWPAAATTAASAISGDKQHAGAFSDAAATALVVADARAAPEIVKKFDLTAALQVDADGNIYPLAAMAQRLAHSRRRGLY